MTIKIVISTAVAFTIGMIIGIFGFEKNSAIDTQLQGYENKKNANLIQRSDTKHPTDKLHNHDYLTEESSLNLISTKQASEHLIKLSKENSILAQTLPEDKQPSDFYDTGSLSLLSQAIEQQYIADAKSVMISIEQNDFTQLQQQFNEETHYSNEAMQYQSNISQFLHQKSDKVSLNSIECKQDICAVEINVIDTQGFQSVFNQLTQQPWWNSMTYTRRSNLNDSELNLILQNYDTQSFNDNQEADAADNDAES